VLLSSIKSPCSGVGVSLLLSSPSLPISLPSSPSSFPPLLFFFFAFRLLIGFFRNPPDSFFIAREPEGVALSEFADLSDMSDGGPVGRTAFKDESEMFSASNSTGPGFTKPVYFCRTNCSSIFSTGSETTLSSSSRLTLPTSWCPLSTRSWKLWMKSTI